MAIGSFVALTAIMKLSLLQKSTVEKTNILLDIIT